MERHMMTRRRMLGVGAATLAGATLATAAPKRALAALPDAGAININTFLSIVDRGLNHGDLTVIDQNVSPAMIEHQIYGLNWPTGINAIKALVVTLRTAFPDLHASILDVGVTNSGHVVGRAFTTGTFTGNYLGIPGNGNPIGIEIHDEFRFEHLAPSQLARGQTPQVVEHWGVADILTLFLEMQLAAIDPSKLPVYP